VDSVAHWDEVESYRREAGHLAGTWFDLGSAAGTVGVGLKRIQVDPGKWSTPAHSEGAEEEIFFVLAGSGISWQDDGRGGVAYKVGEGDCLLHLPEEEAHTLRAGPDGLDVLAFGQRIPQGNTVLPRAGVAWMGMSWVDVGGTHPWEREAAAGEPEVGELMERPPRIVGLDDAEIMKTERGDASFVSRELGLAVESVATGISHITIAAGKTGFPPHCHSAEEELFVVLAGDGLVVLGDDEHPVRRGHVVSRPPGTRVPHSFGAGNGGLVYLAYGTRDPNDIAYYPRSNKVNLRGVGMITRLEKLDYWDGEPDH
jgi:uncharacterized cupin superfamily protein